MSDEEGRYCIYCGTSTGGYCKNSPPSECTTCYRGKLNNSEDEIRRYCWKCGVFLMWAEPHKTVMCETCGAVSGHRPNPTGRCDSNSADAQTGPTDKSPFPFAFDIDPADKLPFPFDVDPRSDSHQDPTGVKSLVPDWGKTIALDFDGTLFEQNPVGFPEPGKPIWPVINEAMRRRSMGASLMLWTLREGKSLEAALTACNKVGIIIDGVYIRKCPADEYWEDRAVKPQDIIAEASPEDLQQGGSDFGIR